jgi:signal peptidase II
MKKRAIILTAVLVFALVILDQIVKIIINNNFTMNERVIIVNNFLMLHPTLNTGFMGPLVNFFALFNINISEFIITPFIKTIQCLIALAAVILAYRYLTFALKERKKSVYFCIVAYIGGIICSWIDGVFWGGSLDYIFFLFFPYIFDLKDVYLTVSTFLIILFGVIPYLKNYYKLSKEERKKEDKEISLIKWFRKGCPLERS